jgi:hypothetical protein
MVTLLVGVILRFSEPADMSGHFVLGVL